MPSVLRGGSRNQNVTGTIFRFERSLHYRGITVGEITVRAATEADLEAILDIYNEQVLNSTATFDIEPRTMAAQREWVEQFDERYVLLVAEDGGEVAGWGCLHPYGSKPGYRFSTENSVYVRADKRRTGVGARLLEALIAAGEANGFRTIIARIAGDNPVSVALHERFGFEIVGVEREVGYKFERWVDVVEMQRMLGREGQ
jgi:L-amino acid N-acyltransferase